MGRGDEERYDKTRDQILSGVEETSLKKRGLTAI